MVKSWFRRNFAPDKTKGMHSGWKYHLDLWAAHPKRFLHVWWYHCIKFPVYTCIAVWKPLSKIGRKHRTEQARAQVHADVAARVRPAKSPVDLLVFSVIDWHFRIQRPQHLCRRLARMDYRVFYVETSIHDTPSSELSRRGYVLIDNPEPDIYVIQLHCDLRRPRVYGSPMRPAYTQEFIRGLTQLRKDFGIRCPVSLVENPFWRPLVESFPGDLVIYDCLDHHAGFGTGRAEMEAEEERLLRAADVVITSSARLAEKVSRVAPSLLVRNAGEFDFFSRKPPTTKRPSNRPVVGYFGAISVWFDMELVRTAARRFPDWDFWLIGAASEANRAAARGVSNIIFEGEVPYTELPPCLHGIDVCVIPFLENELTRCTSPVKVYEYLSAGKPVVTTWMPELDLIRDQVCVAKSHSDFLEGLKAAMESHGSQEAAQKRIAWAADHDWSARARQIDAEICKQFPLVSVVIVTYNNRALTEACLASLLDFTDYPNLEIILVDNASTDGSVDFLRAFAAQHPQVRFIENKKNTGFAAGNNAGIKVARGEFIVLLNNDTYCTRGWLRGLLRHVLKDPGIGAIGPVTNNIGNEAKIDLEYSTMTGMAVAALEYTRAHLQVLLNVRSVAFFCVLIPQAVIDKVGLLDESFGLGFFEDDDYCNRIRQAGYRVVIADDVFIHHELSASFGKLASSSRQELFQANLKIYEAKWGKWVPHKYRSCNTRNH